MPVPRASAWLRWAVAVGTWLWSSAGASCKCAMKCSDLEPEDCFRYGSYSTEYGHLHQENEERYWLNMLSCLCLVIAVS